MITKKLQQFKELQEEIAKHVGLGYFDGEIHVLDGCYWYMNKEKELLYHDKKDYVEEDTIPFRKYYGFGGSFIHKGTELTAIEDSDGGYLIFLNSMEVKKYKRVSYE